MKTMSMPSGRPNTQLSSQDIEQIRRDYLIGGYTQKELANKWKIGLDRLAKLFK